MNTFHKKQDHQPLISLLTFSHLPLHNDFAAIFDIKWAAIYTITEWTILGSEIVKKCVESFPSYLSTAHLDHDNLLHSLNFLLSERRERDMGRVEVRVMRYWHGWNFKGKGNLTFCDIRVQKLMKGQGDNREARVRGRIWILLYLELSHSLSTM